MDLSRPALRRLAWTALACWVLLLGYFAATFEGFVPKNPKQLLVIVFLVGPLLILAEPLLGLTCGLLGKVALPIVSGGRARVEASGDEISFPWHGVSRDANGKLVVSADGAAVFGFILVALVAAAALSIHALR